MLARSATAGQATFEPDEDEDEEPDDEDDEPLLTFSEAFLSLLPDLSPDESALGALSGFLASEPAKPWRPRNPSARRGCRSGKSRSL